MNTIHFHKYQGTGNDFVLLDGRKLPSQSILTKEQIRLVCDRHFGVGADGLIILADEDGFDFRMDYYNADGRPGSMCGNGGRCTVAFAHALGRIGSTCHFKAFDGPHRAEINHESNYVHLQMNPVDQVTKGNGYFFMDTGSPHHVQFVDALDLVLVNEEGRRIRYGSPYGEEGANVNFVEKTDAGIRMATYERGVEAETLSCGTGVTAAALSYVLDEQKHEGSINVQTKGGILEVRFRQVGNRFSDIWLCGPAKKVFEGTIDITDYGNGQN